MFIGAQKQHNLCMQLVNEFQEDEQIYTVLHLLKTGQKLWKEWLEVNIKTVFVKSYGQNSV